MAALHTRLALVAVASMSARDVCATCSASTGQTTNGMWFDDHAIPDSTCSITIPPPDQDECEYGIRLTFTRNDVIGESGFNTERNRDWVYIFAGDGSDVDCTAASNCADGADSLYALTGTCNEANPTCQFETPKTGGVAEVTYERIDRGQFCNADDVENNGCERPRGGIARQSASATIDESSVKGFMLTTDMMNPRLYLVSTTDGSVNGDGFSMYWSCRETCPVGQGTVLSDYHLYESCSECPTGQYDAGGMPYDFLKDACKNCDPGTESSSLSSGRSSCDPCPAGKFLDPELDDSSLSKISCNSCPEGKTSDAGATECNSCPEGKTSDAGATECIPDLNKISNSSRIALSKTLAAGVMMLAAMWV